MKALDPERWRAVSPHLERALELNDVERASFLEGLHRSEPSVAADLEALLADRNVLDREAFLEGVPTHAAAPSALAGQTLGAYTLDAPIGQGGMGSVWLAHRSDGRFEGRAAVKLLNASLLGRAGEERFKREGSILARLAHPHIARLLDAGVSPSGQHYLVLEYVDGVPVDVHCDRNALSVEQRVRLFLDVLSAVEHAHANLIVHRDIKPSNVLVAKGGVVKLLDFGIAKLVEDDGGAATALTREGGRALTPQYAAPEQVTGGQITTATDVHALGTLLYVLLVGRHPAHAALSSPADLMKAIVDTDPERPSTAVTETGSPGEEAGRAAARSTSPDGLRRALKGDLDTILAKALKKDPAERYASVGALADDLRRTLAHEPIGARPDTLPYRAAKFVRRNRLAAALASLAALALAVGIAGTATQARRAARQAALARAESERAGRSERAVVEQRDFALRQLAHVEAINDLDTFLLSDAAPPGRPFTLGQLLAAAEEVAAREGGESEENRVLILISLGRQYRTLEKDETAERLLRKAFELSARLPDRSLRARASCALATSIAERGETRRAEALVEEGLASLPDEVAFTFDRVFCLLRGCDVATTRGDPAASVERAVAAQRLLTETGMGSALLRVRVAMELAEAYRGAARYKEADAAFRDAFERLTALGRAETATAGTLLNNWALTINAVGRPLDAEPLFRRAVQISRAGGKEEDVSPMLLTNLARTLRDLGRLREASEYADRAYGEAARAGDQTVINQSLAVRASLARMRGDLASADRLVDEFQQRCERILPPGHPGLASAASERALLLQAKGDLAAAAEAADRAVEIASSGGARSEMLARVLLRRAELSLQTGRLEAARRDAEEAHAFWREVAGPAVASSTEGHASLVLGRIALAQGRRDEARAAFVAAAEELAPSIGAGQPETIEARRLATESEVTRTSNGSEMSPPRGR